MKNKKELVYNSIGTVFADKFDIEFKVKEDVTSTPDIAERLEISFPSTDKIRTAEILKRYQINSFIVENNIFKFQLPVTRENAIKNINIKRTLESEGLINGEKRYVTKATKGYDVTRMVRCDCFRRRLAGQIRSGYESRGGSDDRNETIRRLDLSSAEKERTFFKEKLNVCIKDYENMFQDALLTKEYVKLEKYVNEVFKIFNIPKTKENYDSISRDNTLLNVLKDYI